jgi:hypothetical protein
VRTWIESRRRVLFRLPPGVDTAPGVRRVSRHAATARHLAPGKLAMLTAVLLSLVAGRDACAVIEGYPSDASLVTGDTLQLHVRATNTYRVSIYRMGAMREFVLNTGTYPAHNFAVPLGSWATGCEWPVTCSIPVRAEWRPGAYAACLESGSVTSWLPFVVRGRVPGRQSGIVVQLTCNTWQAYNRYGGKSLYGAWLPGLTGRTYRVSFQRPYALAPSDGDGVFFLWEVPFIAFLEREAIAYEVITNYDLHRFPGILDSYHMFCSVGHDEYWSKEMYDELERFVNSGGNAAFFSGNTIWWQVRYEDGGRTMVCYKDAALDPLNGIDNSRVTVNWQSAPVNRPPAALLGTHYNGSWGIAAGAFQVANPRHWAYRGVAVDSGQSFGYPMVAFEVDARNQFSPRVDLIASTTLIDANNNNVVRAADMTYYERTAAYGFPNGRGGKVFAASSVNYSQGIDTGYNPATKTVGHIDPVARSVTLNVIDRLGCDVAAPRLSVPADGTQVHTPKALLQWFPAVAHRSGVPMRYTLYWQQNGATADSLNTVGTSAWIPVAEGEPYHWWVRAWAECGATRASPVAGFLAARPTDSGPPGVEPEVLAQHVGDQVEIRVSVATPASVSLDIYSISGRRVRSLGSRLLPAGTSRIVWNLRDAHGVLAPSGIYLVRAGIGERVLNVKVMLVH